MNQIAKNMEQSVVFRVNARLGGLDAELTDNILTERGKSLFSRFEYVWYVTHDDTARSQSHKLIKALEHTIRRSLLLLGTSIT